MVIFNSYVKYSPTYFPYKIWHVDVSNKPFFWETNDGILNAPQADWDFVGGHFWADIWDDFLDVSGFVVFMVFRSFVDLEGVTGVSPSGVAC